MGPIVAIFPPFPPPGATVTEPPGVILNVVGPLAAAATPPNWTGEELKTEMVCPLAAVARLLSAVNSQRRMFGREIITPT